MGFESGGLAVAHSVAQGLTVIPEVHHNYMHGEMVAIGLLTQLVLETKVDEAREVAGFFAQVGLPVHLGQISLSLFNEAQIRDVMEAAMMLPFVANEPFAVSIESLITAIARAHEMGLEVAQSAGDVPYRALHGNRFTWEDVMATEKGIGLAIDGDNLNFWVWWMFRKRRYEAAD